jgi:hypothetical protein
VRSDAHIIHAIEPIASHWCHSVAHLLITGKRQGQGLDVRAANRLSRSHCPNSVGQRLYQGNGLRRLGHIIHLHAAEPAAGRRAWTGVVKRRLRAQPNPNASIDVEMIKMAVAGFAMAVIVTHLLGLRERGLLLPKLLGVAAGMLFFHNFVHLWPQVFETLFSPIWAAKIMSMTEPHSIYWRGISIPF